MSKPNIVFIVSDQHRGDFMGSAGNRVVRTPNLDHLAEGGVRFTNAYCNAPLCVPSRMSMLTGRYPHQTGVFANSDHLASDIPTFVHGLGLGGYETVLCGRMHFVGPDQRHGYERRLVGDITPTYLGGPSTAYGDLKGTSGQGLRSIVTAGPGNSPVIHYDEQVTQAYEQYVSERSSDAKRPLFITVGLYGPHHPFISPREQYEQAVQAMKVNDTPMPPDSLPRHPWLEHWFRRLEAEQITPELQFEARANYIGLVNRLDQLVGRIVEASAALPGDTWIVYVSDHGEMAGDKGMFWKRSFYEGALRVPMIWHPLRLGGSDVIVKGAAIDTPVSLVDLAPTFLAATQSPAPSSLAGNDLSPLLFGDDRAGTVWEQEPPVFVELLTPQDSAIRMVRQGDYKLIYFHNYPPVQLFDLRSDPQETTNLAEREEYRDLVQRLTGLVLQGWDPDSLISSSLQRHADQALLAQWGKQIGLERHEVWNPEIRGAQEHGAAHREIAGAKEGA
ncbi:Choline-sulfatase [Paenibacillus solanacearum]|uniref:Choline-sulfatase n=1 Tax=Paenibacillus solanacearum TaxID=2048548 RepID=A0A916K4E1_9BACL|nr:sulfatase-like hydrolase/transferase [Paenibacillus solanacearum]CAG7623127.1 Choline-sulfatase [Paenibacillus solanacearum]